MQKGFSTILSVVIILSISLVLISGFSVLTLNSQKVIYNKIQSLKSYYVSESGVEDAVYRIAKNKQYSANYNLSVGSDSAVVSISGTNTKTITSQSNLNNIFRNIQAILNITTVNSQFYYGAQVGEGGVVMKNNSRIEGAGGAAGNLYSNGSVIGNAGATITGNVTVATGIALDVESAVCNSDQIIGQTNPQIDFAQSFKPLQSKSLNKVSLYMKKVGSPADRTIRIAADSAGSPSTSALASAILNASLVTTSYGWVDIVFSSPANLTAGATYWLILDVNQDSTKYWIWCKDINSGYVDGVGKYKQDWSSGGAWTSITGDLTFKTYLGTGVSSIDNVIVYGTARVNTIINSKICGDAYYQSILTIDTLSKNFLDSPSTPTCPTPLTPGTGFPDQPDPPVALMPISDANIAQWKADAQVGGIIIGDYNLTTSASLGPKQITGNLNMISNNKTLTVAGTIYVQGNVDVSNGSAIRCDPSYGATSCMVVVDGWMHFSNNGAFSGSGQAGSYVMLLTTLSGCLAGADGGSPLPFCTHHNSAIDLHNNATGAIFYAVNSAAYLHNGVNVTEIIAYKLNLDNNAVVTYEQGLQNATFSSGPGASFKINNWQEIP